MSDRKMRFLGAGEQGEAAEAAAAAASVRHEGALVDAPVSKVRQSRPPASPQRPLDWPGPGPIDLDVHDLPHASSTTEWWYTNGHLTAEDGRRFSFFAAFFRQAKGRNAKTGEYEYAHSVTWALVDVQRKRFLHASRVDASAPAEGLKRLRQGLGSTDDRLNRALAEILERGTVPSPDRLFDGRVFVGKRRLELDYSGDSFRKQDDGSYWLRLLDRDRNVGCDLVFVPRKPPARHGDDGVVRGSDNERMFYYFIPRCELRGEVTVDGVTLAVADGQGWYDHEFGMREGGLDDEEDAGLDPQALARLRAERRARREDDAIGWDWLSVQLDDGTDVSVYPLTYLKTGKSAGAWAVVVDPAGNQSVHHDLVFEPVESWQSTQTFFEYPVRWRCEIPGARIRLDVRAAFEDQEFITLISKPSFWEGRVEVTGTHRGAEVQGPGFVERSGFTPYEDLDGFFKSVSKVVRRSVEEVIPFEPSYEQARLLIGSETSDHYMDGLDVEQFARTMIRPIREITDRGGKGWRSYAAITCCDIVGGDSREFVQWLALPEMMHVGSLIIDDVQDKSVVRRGGPTAHMIYGEGQAINSGTAAYFLGQKLLVTPGISDANLVRLYHLYFEALRAGHAGQAIDLDGLDAYVPPVVESGNGEELERRVLAIHRLKTAAPAGCLARMGAIAGGGSDAQVEALGRFFEGLGLAFQIVDDVLNLRGFRGELKARGEDITQGKVTLPVAKALSRLELDRRRWLHETVSSKPEDTLTVRRVIDALEGCGAVEDCMVQARTLIEDGWKELDPLVEPSLAKMMLRGFGWFVLERHY